ncbi:hypothetical protein LBMAG42_17340 [Deltaproteobacteria bacterium]|nr:hypothetical protein LBMAG42_17340 [Deltaproteobacteria bacterium]
MLFPLHFTVGLFGGVEAEIGAAPMASIPLPVPPAFRVSWRDGWGLDVDTSLRLDDRYAMTARLNLVWTPAPTATWVPYIHAGVAYGNRDVPPREAGGRLGVGPNLGAGLEWWVAPNVALDTLVDADVLWSTPLDQTDWVRTVDVGARLGLRFDLPAAKRPYAPPTR